MRKTRDNCLTIAACRDILPAMNISHGKTDRTIKYLTVSDNVYIVSKEKA